MTTKKLTTAIAATLALCACGGGEDAAREAAEQAEKQSQDLEKEITDGAQQLENALTRAFGGGEDGEPIETVSARTLKEMLPEKIGEMPRSSFSAQKNAMMGFKMTTAEATYTGDDGQSLLLEVSDIGAMQGLATLGLNWMNVEVDEESDKGFRRTVEYKGHRSMQSYSTAGSRSEGEMSVFVNGRFVVKVSGKDVAFEDIEEAVDMLPIDEFEKLSESTS